MFLCSPCQINLVFVDTSTSNAQKPNYQNYIKTTQIISQNLFSKIRLVCRGANTKLSNIWINVSLLMLVQKLTLTVHEPALARFTAAATWRLLPYINRKFSNPLHQPHHHHHHHHHHVPEALGVFSFPWSSRYSWSLHLFLGRPMFLCPFGLYCSASFDSLFVSILCTCCSHFFWYCFISFTMFCAPVFCLIRKKR